MIIILMFNYIIKLFYKNDIINIIYFYHYFYQKKNDFYIVDIISQEKKQQNHGEQGSYHQKEHYRCDCKCSIYSQGKGIYE